MESIDTMHIVLQQWNRIFWIKIEYSYIMDKMLGLEMKLRGFRLICKIPLSK